VDQKASRAAGTPEQKSPPAGWHYMTATPPPDETGRVWRLGVYARGSFALKLVGVPEYVALREGDVFRMDSAELLAPRADLPVRH
jgi:hypothetical protein